MTDITVRPAEADRDAERIASLHSTAYPFGTFNAEAITHRLSTSPAHIRALELVADVGGRTIGHGLVAFEPEFGEGQGRFVVIVDPDHQGRGVGSALYQPMLEHARAIGVTKLVGRLIDARALDIALAHGFTKTRIDRISHVSLDKVPAPFDPPEGIRLVPQSELDDFRAMYAIDSAVLGDIPADTPFVPLPYEDWCRKYAEDPKLNAECTVLAFDADTVAAVAWMDGGDDKVWSSLTGVRREYRGRGLAKLVKTHALDRARRRGATDAYTSNDSTNAGMLAVNDWLGYEPYVEQHAVVRDI
ncbi:MAG TPA: GNAT family N-acetyltransferase [Stackebrandtia sp.]|jgi:GNAT superfamily N-acetyltransferase|uniref:GNAT family N-acetyltransferase n=1 Tax=Stackebrandtia sp. TaxID=2023065 RepID=UPI002D3E5551|nr:GNAT family N-acetyltransferase [Stackebrandtia sp.]HZE39787.1 GNAT family N-acetyltransferase [Stackebrandtia sp.]